MFLHVWLLALCPETCLDALLRLCPTARKRVQLTAHVSGMTSQNHVLGCLSTRLRIQMQQEQPPKLQWLRQLHRVLGPEVGQVVLMGPRGLQEVQVLRVLVRLREVPRGMVELLGLLEWQLEQQLRALPVPLELLASLELPVPPGLLGLPGLLGPPGLLGLPELLPLQRQLRALPMPRQLQTQTQGQKKRWMRRRFLPGPRQVFLGQGPYQGRRFPRHLLGIYKFSHRRRRSAR